MSASSPNEGTNRHSLKWIVVPSFLYGLLHIGAGASPAWLWGVDGIVYAPWVLCIASLISIVVFLVASRYLCVKHFDVDVGMVLTCSVVFLAASLAWPSSTRLLGDGLLHARELAGGVWDSHPRMNRAPLTFWTLHALSAIGGLEAADLYAWFSRLSGIFFVILSGIGAHVFAERPAQRTILFLVVVLQGYLQLFFGYVENYPILFPATAAFLVLAEQSRVGRLPVLLPAALLGLMAPLHFTTLALVPVLLWVAWSRPERDAQTRVISCLAILAVPAVSILILLGIGLGPASFLESEPGNHLLPLMGSLEKVEPYTQVSGAHLIEIFNQYALVAPAFVCGCVVLVAAFDRRNGTDVLLLCAAGPLCTFTVLFNPAIGAFRDWDAFSLSALPLTILVVRCLFRFYSGSKAACAASAILLSVSVAHSIPWIAINADVEASESRFRTLVSEGNLSILARAYGAESLAARYRDSGRLDQALEAFEQASAYDPVNGRYEVGRAYVLNQLGRRDEAEHALKLALEKTPDRLEAMINLGKLYLASGRLSEAEEILRAALGKNTASAPVIHTLGLVAYRLGELERAHTLFGRAATLEPQNTAYRVDVGTTLLAMGKLSEAEAVLREAVANEPTSVSARMNLGSIAYQRDDHAAATAAFKSVLEIDASHAAAHQNLGISLLAVGDSLGARTHLETAVDLDPESPDADAVRALIRQIDVAP